MSTVLAMNQLKRERHINKLTLLKIEKPTLSRRERKKKEKKKD